MSLNVGPEKMKKSLKHQSIERKNSDVCVVTDYPIGDEAIDFAIVKMTSRYPSARQAVNQKCKEIVYVHEGSGKVVVNDQEHALKEGDVILIEAGEKFYWDGNLTLFISCHPSFTPEQHHVID